MEGFKSDGCTGWFDLNYHGCCVAHDFAAYIGYPDSLADMDLFDCVKGLAGVGMAVTMFVGLKLFRPFYRAWWKNRR